MRSFFCRFLLFASLLCFSCSEHIMMQVQNADDCDIHYGGTAVLEFAVVDAKENAVVEFCVSDDSKLEIISLNDEVVTDGNCVYTVRKGDTRIECVVRGLSICENEKVVARFLGAESVTNVNVSKYRVVYHTYSAQDGWTAAEKYEDLDDDVRVPSFKGDVGSFLVDGAEYIFTGRWTAVDLSGSSEPDDFTGAEYTGLVDKFLHLYATYKRKPLTLQFKKMNDDGSGWVDITLPAGEISSGVTLAELKLKGLADPGEFACNNKDYVFKGWTDRAILPEDVEFEGEDLKLRGGQLNVDVHKPGHKIADSTVFYAAYHVKMLDVKYYYFDMVADDWVLDTQRSKTVKYGTYPAAKEPDLEYPDWKYVCTGWTTEPLSGRNALREKSVNPPTPYTNPLSGGSDTKLVQDTKLYATYRFSYQGDMVYVPGGTFDMQGDSNFPTTLDGFCISKYELSQGVYEEVMGSLSDLVDEEGDKYPVYGVDWYDAVEFCNELSKMEGLDPYYVIDKDKGTDCPNYGKGYALNDSIGRGSDDSGDLDSYLVKTNDNGGYRLPIEAEWEYAAKGGYPVESYTYSGSNDLSEVGWNNGELHEIGKKKANRLGVYDMSGNVAEWCWDWYYEGSQISGPGWFTDSNPPSAGVYPVSGSNPIFVPSGNSTELLNPGNSDFGLRQRGWYHGNNRIIRGGSYESSGINIVECQNTNRRHDKNSNDDSSKFLGFRVVRSKI